MKRISLRLIPELWQKMVRLAAKHRRSLNAEISMALEKWIEMHKTERP